MKRQYIVLYGYDDSKVKVPIPKYGYWWTKSHGPRCVVGCKNYPDIVHITEKGLANISYCKAHAELRILRSLLTGETERGLWCYCKKGKLSPHWNYDWFISMARDLIKSGKKSHVIILEKRIKLFKKLGLL